MKDLPQPRRVVVSPRSSGGTADRGVLSVVLEESEEVIWTWITSPAGQEYVSGYAIRKIPPAEMEIATIPVSR